MEGAIIYEERFGKYEVDKKSGTANTETLSTDDLVSSDKLDYSR